MIPSSSAAWQRSGSEPVRGRLRRQPATSKPTACISAPARAGRRVHLVGRGHLARARHPATRALGGQRRRDRLPLHARPATCSTITDPQGCTVQLSPSRELPDIEGASTPATRSSSTSAIRWSSTSAGVVSTVSTTRSTRCRCCEKRGYRIGLMSNQAAGTTVAQVADEARRAAARRATSRPRW